MKDQYVNLLSEGTVVDSVFAVRSKELRSARTGDAYLALDLADRTGRIGAVMFRPGADAAAVPAGSVVRVRGTVTTYRGVMRVALESMRPAGSYSREDLLPEGRREAQLLQRHRPGAARARAEGAISATLRALPT